MDQDRILYRGEAFTLTGNSLRQDAAHWAEVQPDGQVKASPLYKIGGAHV